MLTKVSAFTDRLPGEALVMNLTELNVSDLIQVRNIDGLDPVAADISKTPAASRRGSFVTGKHTPDRNLVFTLGMNPDWVEYNFSKLRDLLALYFMPESSVRLVFESDDKPEVEISGTVESNSQTIFSKDPEAQISIICPDPDFVAIETTYFNGEANDAEIEIPYPLSSSIETGIQVGVEHVDGDDPTIIQIYMGSEDDLFIVNTTSVDSDNAFILNSIPGQRALESVNITTLVRTSILQDMADGSIWPKLKPGSNGFRVTTNMGVNNWTLAYKERYGSL